LLQRCHEEIGYVVDRHRILRPQRAHVATRAVVAFVTGARTKRPCRRKVARCEPTPTHRCLKPGARMRPPKSSD
jgi:hypothetical protein